MNTVTLRNIQIGRGIPKVIVPIAEQSREGILAMGKRLSQSEADAVEWRADYYDGLAVDTLVPLLGELRACLGDMPLIFTCRTQKEGGRADISDEKYAELNRTVLHSGNADAIDIEVFSHGKRAAELIWEIRKEGFVSIGSCHLAQMPQAGTLEDMFNAIQGMGADITKLAAMAQSTEDTLTLMAAARQAKQRGVSPLIAIAMGEHGIISRALAELTGSDGVFAALGKGTAPGQLSLEATRKILKTIHENIR